MAKIYTNVDEIFDGLSEGEAQHMTNKLFKHGYVSPQAPKAVAPPRPAPIPMSEQEMLDDLSPYQMVKYCVNDRGMTLDRIASLYLEAKGRLKCR
jgi:hypothetical protein